VKKCKQQRLKDLQAPHQQIPNRLSPAHVRFISPGENRRDLGHVPQLFRRFLSGSCCAKQHIFSNRKGLCFMDGCDADEEMPDLHRNRSLW
jgi:hypothetical protein